MRPSRTCPWVDWRRGEVRKSILPSLELLLRTRRREEILGNGDARPQAPPEPKKKNERGPHKRVTLLGGAAENSCLLVGHQTLVTTEFALWGAAQPRVDPAQGLSQLSAANTIVATVAQ